MMDRPALRVDPPGSGRDRFLALVLLAAAGSLASVPALAAEFHPEIALDQTYNSNLLTLPEGEETSDSVTRVAVALPVLEEWRTGSLTFRYEPSYEWYRDSEALDHDEHRLALGVLSQPGQRSLLDYRLGFSRTQDQGTIGDTPVGGTVLVPRSERDLLETDLHFEREVTARFGWHGALRAARIEHTLLGDPDADPTTGGLEDRTLYGGSVGLDRTLTRTDQLSVEAGYDFYDLEVSGEEKLTQLILAWSRSVPERFEAELRVGGFRRDTDPGESGTPLAADDESGMSFGLDLARVYRRSRLGIAASQAPSGGGSIVGTSTDTVARLYWSGAPGPRWSWILSSAYTARNPTSPEVPELTTTGGGGSVEWRPLPRAGFRLEAEHSKRSGDDPTLDATVSIARFAVIWYPRGPARPAGGER